jgi:hemolysin activation/secretion protein
MSLMTHQPHAGFPAALALSGVLMAGTLVAQAQVQHARAATLTQGARVEVIGFEIQGNTLLDARELQVVVAPFVGDRSLDELNQAAQALQRRYASAGYGAVVVYVPPLEPGNPVVRLAVLEGKVGQIAVLGQQHASADRVRTSLPDLLPGATPNLRRIDAQVQLANENPARHIGVVLKPGSQPGQTDVDVNVRDVRPQSLHATLDNTGSSATGRLRLALGWQHANLSDRDDTLNLQYQTSTSYPSRVRVASAGYRLPIYTLVTMLDLFVADSEVDGGVVGTAIGDVRFNGSGRVLGVRATRFLPRLGAADQRVAVGVDHRRFRSRCDLMLPQQGNSSCGSIAGNVLVTPLSLDYILRSGPGQSWTVQIGAQTNVRMSKSDGSAENFAGARAGASPAYSLFRLATSGSLRLADSLSLQGRLAAQRTGSALIPGEQFGLGGAASVRGYAERELLADSGAVVALELHGPSWAVGGPAGAQLQGMAFLDWGYGRNNGDTACLGLDQTCVLAAAGVGARVQWGTLQARVDVARALRDASQTERGDSRGHLSVSYTF